MQKLRLKDITEKVKHMDIYEAIEYLYEIKETTSLNVDKLISKAISQKEKHEKELQRLEIMTEYEKKAYLEGHNYIAGVDEAGRGPLAGPVVAAAVVLPKDIIIPGLNDSKKLSAAQRDRLYNEILQKALSYSVGVVDEKTIDEINILKATKKAMKIAVDKLSHNPDILLVDAERIDDIPHKQVPIIKGDSLSVSIAAASIVAKVTRDRMMDELCQKYPKYGFSKHKGYGTKEHIEAIKKEGICPIHRVSFTKNFIN